MPLPTLARIAAVAAAACGLETETLLGARTSDGDDARMALDLYAWLADLLTARNRCAIGLYVGVDDGRVRAGIAATEAARNDAPFATATDEMLLELHAEAEALARLGIIGPPDIDAEIIAGRLLGARRDAMRVTLAEIRTLARGFIAICGDLALQKLLVEQMGHDVVQMQRRVSPRDKEIVAARIALDRALYTPGERAARERLAAITNSAANGARA